MQFPRTKPEIDAQVRAVLSGIAASPTDFPRATFDTKDLTALSAATAARAGERQQKESAFRLSVEAENDAYDAQNVELRRLLDLAMAAHKGNPDKLTALGWGAPAAPAKRVPGQPRTLEARREASGTVFLDWKAPRKTDGGGNVAFYRIERRVKGGEEFGAWQATATASEAHLSGQPHGVEIEYRILAVNPAGDSLPSNAVALVL